MGPTNGGGSRVGQKRWFRWALIALVAGSAAGGCGRAPLGENPIPLAECGDALCAPVEDADTCPSDCVCGDGICSLGESNSSCEADCPRNCGNGICNSDET